MSGAIHYFEPLFPAVVYQCNLCGDKLAEDAYAQPEAEDCRRQTANGSLLFCTDCSRHVDNIARQIAAEGAKMDAEHERTRQERLREIAKREMAKRPGGGTAAPPRDAASPAPPSLASRSRLQGSIPIPERN